MTRILFWIIGAPFALLVILFAISNQDIATYRLWPLPWVLQMPQYLSLFILLFISLLLFLLWHWLVVTSMSRKLQHSENKIHQKNLLLEQKESEIKDATANLKIESDKNQQLRDEVQALKNQIEFKESEDYKANLENMPPLQKDNAQPAPQKEKKIFKLPSIRLNLKGMK